MDSQIEEIKNKLNVLDVIGSYVKLTKTGINYRGICPFHSEKSPSFFVSPMRQMWHCFGCGSGSSIFDFVMKIEGVEFGDALRILAAKAGIELKKENVQLRTERQRLYEICNLACNFFEKQLEASVNGKEAADYLQKRGIKKDSIKKWRIGYSPDTWNGLTDFLISKNYKREEIIKAGLATTKENNKSDSYDRFRGRIIFPIFDLNSRVIGFGGRVFKQQGETAKYINTPQTLLYDKSSVLYGLNSAKLEARKQNRCVITEGYTDVIMCHQAGFENTVASSGTALTEKHLGILKRYSENLVLAFDMDIAGDSATKRGINLAEEQGFNIKIIESYKPASDKDKKWDPADIIAKDQKIWAQSLEKAKSIMDYYFDSAFSNFNKEMPESKKEIGRIILPAIKRLQSKIEQSHWIQKLARMLGVKEEIIEQELAKTKSDRNLQIHPNTANNPSDKMNSEDKTTLSEENRKKLIEEKIISLILKNPDYIKLVGEDHYRLFSEKIVKFLRSLKQIIDLPEDQLNKGEEKPSFAKPPLSLYESSAADKALVDKSNGQGVIDNKDFKIALEAVVADDNEFKNFVAALSLKIDIAREEDGEKEIKLCLFQLKNIELKNKLSKISEDIKEAELKEDHQKVSNLMEEFNKLTKEL